MLENAIQGEHQCSETDLRIRLVNPRVFLDQERAQLHCWTFERSLLLQPGERWLRVFLNAGQPLLLFFLHQDDTALSDCLWQSQSEGWATIAQAPLSGLEHLR